MTREELQKRKDELLKAMGVQLLVDSVKDYHTKSQGDTGLDGEKWKPLAPSTVQRKNQRKLGGRGRGKSKLSLEELAFTDIGIDTGRQLKSASPGYSGQDGQGGNLFEQDAESVTVGYNRDYSEHFDEVRPLLPEILPEDWVQHQEEIIEKWAEQIIEQGMKQQ